MRSLLAQELEAFKSLVCDHYSSYNYKRPRWEDYYDPCFFNIIANGADTPRPGSHSTVQEAEKALDDELWPGMIEYTSIEDSNKKTTGFFLRVGDPLTGKPLQTSGSKALVVFCGAEEFSKALSLRRLSRKFICGYSNSLILPIEFRPGIDQMLCPIQNTIWQPPGFGYFMPIEIEYKIDKSGIISGASFKKMCGIAEADKAALDFIRKCQYNPLLEINKEGLKGSCKFGTACANNRLLAAWPANSDWVEKLTPEEKDNKNLLAFWQYKISELEFGIPNSIHNPLTGSTQLPYESRSNDDVVKTSHAKPHIAPEFGSYMAEMQRLLLAQWDKVQGISKKNTTVMFTVKNDGGVTNLKIYKTSGSADCDKAALEAVRRADPLPPLPEHAPSQVDMTFLFATIHERNSKPKALIRK
jgi:TonB family protein